MEDSDEYVETKGKIREILEPLPKDRQRAVLQEVLERETLRQSDADRADEVVAAFEDLDDEDKPEALTTIRAALEEAKALPSVFARSQKLQHLLAETSIFVGSTLTGPVAPLITNTPTRGAPFDFSGGKPSKLVNLPLTDPRFDSNFGSRYPKDRGPPESLLETIQRSTDVVARNERVAKMAGSAQSTRASAEKPLADVRERIALLDQEVKSHKDQMGGLIDKMLRTQLVGVSDSDREDVASFLSECFTDAARLVPKGLSNKEYERQYEHQFKRIAKIRAAQGDNHALFDVDKLYDLVRNWSNLQNAHDAEEAHARLLLAPEDCPSLGYHDEPRSALLQWGAWIRTAVAAGHKFADVMAMASVRLDDLATRAGFKPDPVLIGGFSNVAGIWGATGFPCVMPTHKLAASLMATSMPPEHTPALTLPWPAFLIQIPDGILKMPPRPDQVSVADLPIRYVAIIDSQDPRVAKTHAGFGALGTGTATGAGTTVTRRFMIAAFFHDGRNFTTVFAAFDALEDIGRVPGDTRGTGAFDLVDDKEHALLNRMWEMLGRLFLGALVELDHPNHKSAVRAGPPPPKSPKSKDGHKRPKDTEPRAWIFDLRRDVKVDCRKFVGDYLAGNGKSPAVQVLVRGHHKRQPWGKDSMLRKWIHIEPYWKGPEDAPIAIRSHSMGDKS